MDRRNFIEKTLITLLGAGASGALVSACSSLAGASPKDFKLGVFDETLGKAFVSNPDALRVAKSIGLNGILASSGSRDFAGEFMSPELIASYKSVMAESGMEIASTSPTGFNASPFVDSDNAVSFVNKAVDAAAQLNSHAILLPFYGKARLNPAGKGAKMDERFFKPLVERLKETAKNAEKKDVCICLENSISADDDKRIIDAVGSDYIKVYFDIMNFNYYGFPTVESIKSLKGYIGQVHLKSIAHRLALKSEAPSEGARACIDALIETGYRGWFVFETHGFKKKSLSDIKELLASNSTFVRSL